MDWTYCNDNEPLTFIQLGLPAALVINRIRNAQAIRELVTKETAPTENGKRSDCSAEHRSSVIVGLGAWLPIENECTSHIETNANDHDPLRNAHLLNPDEKQNEDTGGDTDSGRADEKKSAPDEKYIQQRLRDLAAFERRLGRKQN